MSSSSFIDRHHCYGPRAGEVWRCKSLTIQRDDHRYALGSGPPIQDWQFGTRLGSLFVEAEAMATEPPLELGGVVEGGALACMGLQE